MIHLEESGELFMNDGVDAFIRKQRTEDISRHEADRSAAWWQTLSDAERASWQARAGGGVLEAWRLYCKESPVASTGR